MKLYTCAEFSIFFGDKHNQCDPSLYRSFTADQLGSQLPFTVIEQALQATHLFFLHQVHGVRGLTLHQEQIKKQFTSFSLDGDYLITRQRGVALGIVTADCLPIIFYDTKNKICAIAHAGWRGSVLGIASMVLENMCIQYGTHEADVTVFFGPSARVCCYRVDEKFLEPLRNFMRFNSVVVQRADEYFFNVPLYNALVLMHYGVKAESIIYEYNLCTICDERYCSYRRESAMPFRNVTMVVLR